MSDEEGFLARWSRRKRSAALKTRERGERDGAAPTGTPAAATEPPFVDPAALPPIESIGAETDVRAFLAAGVPAELKRAALRKAWSADPAIRGFVGLSENSWDFNAPGGVPGFGSLSAEDVRRLARRLAGEDTDAEAAESSSAERPVATASDDGAAGQRFQEHSEPSPGAAGPPAADASGAVVGPADTPKGGCCPIVPRRHGGALPK
jgi:hypothetical protein